jgi:ribosomal protein S18 acetylase RimI-like enzyme
MGRLATRPFSDEFLGAAGELLAARHRAQRSAEPLLPDEYEDPAATTAEVETLAGAEGASGAVALREGRVVGYLLGAPRTDEVWGPNVWVELAGHAVEEAEDVRDLYAVAGARWIEEERPRHYAVVPESDYALVEAWFRLSFGQQHAFGIREVPEVVTWPDQVRRAEPRDVDALVTLTPLLADHQARAPVFSRGHPPAAPDELRAEILADLGKEEIAELVAERGSEIVGAMETVPVELSSTHTGLARPPGAVLLGWAATLPGVRGSGAGRALTDATFAWARERGHEIIVTDWRVTNLLASRFWPSRGFRPTFLRLYRHIP